MDHIFGEQVSPVGLVLSGSFHLIHEDFWGNRNIVTKISRGQSFAEIYACIQGGTIGVSVISSEKTKILFMDIHGIKTTC